MTAEPERPWEQPAAPDARPWVRRNMGLLIVLAVIAAIVVWTVASNSSNSDRQKLGQSVCEDAVRAQLQPGYEPALTVRFEEQQPSGDFAYSVFTDDGDGQFTCSISESGDPDPSVIDGLVYDD